MKKSLVVMVMAALVASAFVAPAADAKKKKKKKPPVCAPYVPGEMGAGAETITVTDAATAEAPATVAFTQDPHFDEGLTDPTPAYVNVQVDSKAASAGFYVTWEFPMRRDYDLYVRRADGSEAGSSHGFNLLAEAKTNPPLPIDASNTSNNHAGETTATSENIVGLITPDCGGYTLEMLNYFGEGGEFELKIWLGEGTTEAKVEE